MLDHLTGGRLEIGTAIGVPQELIRLNMTMSEARERNDEIVAVLDAAWPIGLFPTAENISRFPMCAYYRGPCSNHRLRDGPPSSVRSPRGGPLDAG
jgi:alkanesulfonate monooxygenase SsuD/methylene tetrahydromethanopterin reductase-like flavin-dependent oxidoreductase (luciferase family)